MTGRSSRAAICICVAAVCVFAAIWGSVIPPDRISPDRIHSDRIHSDRAASAPVVTTGHIGGPYGALLDASTDLGPAREGLVRVTAELGDAAPPAHLTDWALRQGLSMKWQQGDRWAVLQGPPQALADSLRIEIRNYRGPQGQVFYASPQQPELPALEETEAVALGRVLGYTPFRDAQRWMLPLEVPGRGLTPDALMRTYNIDTLHNEGFTGKGTTVVVFAFDGFDQADLDKFSSSFGLPRFVPEVVGGQPPSRRGEATMDLEVIHAVAPDARKVLINARPTVEGDGSYTKIAEMMEDADRRYPGAVWSFSIGWGCDRLITAADLVPVREALAKATSNGTAALDASGDLAGLECKGGQEWSSAPHADDTGLDAVASLPEMTNVGGTTLSTDSDGGWLAEQAWFDGPLSQGSAGGVSALFDRPDWQRALDVGTGRGRRLTPDVSAVADPFTGVRIVFDGQDIVGGGTSQAAPIWAGIAAVMNQYLTEQGGRQVGHLNPLLYAVSQGARRPGFRDIVLGGNAVANAGPGYDLVTGLGTPDVNNLVQNILVLQKLLP